MECLKALALALMEEIRPMGGNACRTTLVFFFHVLVHLLLTDFQSSSFTVNVFFYHSSSLVVHLSGVLILFKDTLLLCADVVQINHLLKQNKINNMMGYINEATIIYIYTTISLQKVV